jgi:uncharacterized protein YbcV (DUF1398 family)
MDADAKELIRQTSNASDAERFPAVVKALMEVGIERYHADLVAGRRTYYLPDGDFEVVEAPKVGGAAGEFSPEGVEKAVRASQRREIGYREFCRRIVGRRLRRLFRQPGWPPGALLRSRGGDPSRMVSRRQAMIARPPRSPTLLQRTISK